MLKLSTFTHIFPDGEVKSDNNELKMTLKDVLQFITGTTCVPPLGFDSEIEIEFCDDALPSASTCLLKLYLPLTDDSRELKKNIAFAIFNAIGFGST